MAISVAPTRDHGHSCRDNQEAGVRSSTVIHIVGCHAEGEVGDVIVGGVAPPPGATLWEQSRWVARDGRLRNLVLNEPRGGVFRHVNRSEEHTSELQSLMRISYAVFCLKQKTRNHTPRHQHSHRS